MEDKELLTYRALLCTICISFLNHTLIESITVSLHSRHLPDVRALQEDCQWPLKNVGSSHRSRNPTIHCNWSNPNLYLDQPITKGRCLPNVIPPQTLLMPPEHELLAVYHPHPPFFQKPPACLLLMTCTSRTANQVS